MVAEACRIGLVESSLSDYGGVNGSSLINGLLYYLITPILNMDILTKEQMQEMSDVLSQNETEEDSQPNITGPFMSFHTIT